MGYSPVDNVVLEALARTNLSAYEWRVLMYIFRYTYGWQKKSDYISIAQIVDVTRLKQSHVSRALKQLMDKHILHKGKTGRIGVQKDYNKWVPLKSAHEHDEVPPPEAENNRTDPAPVEKKTKMVRHKYGEYQNVLLSDDDHARLEEKFGNTLNDRIEELSVAIKSKGYKYKDFKATIESWARRKEKDNGRKSTGAPLQHGDYSRPEDYGG